MYTDGADAYRGVEEGHDLNHAAVRHSVGEYVRGEVHTNGVESFWSMLKRGYYGTYHKMSFKHLQRYVAEFAARHNVRDFNTIDQMAALAKGMEGRRLMYRDLTAGVWTQTRYVHPLHLDAAQPRTFSCATREERKT